MANLDMGSMTIEVVHHSRIVIAGLVGAVVVLLTVLVTMVFADASMRHFVRDCTAGHGRVEVVERQLVCVGGKL